MKQKKIITVVFAALLLSIIAVAQNQKGKAAKVQSLEVSFNYQKQAGPGSNQYAVWIENEKGELVKTLFVTSYAGKARLHRAPCLCANMGEDLKGRRKD